MDNAINHRSSIRYRPISDTEDAGGGISTRWHDAGRQIAQVANVLRTWATPLVDSISEASNVVSRNVRDYVLTPLAQRQASVDTADGNDKTSSFGAVASSMAHTLVRAASVSINVAQRAYLRFSGAPRLASDLEAGEAAGLLPRTSLPEDLPPENLPPENLPSENLSPENLLPENLLPESPLPESPLPMPRLPPAQAEADPEMSLALDHSASSRPDVLVVPRNDTTACEGHPIDSTLNQSLDTLLETMREVRENAPRDWGALVDDLAKCRPVLTVAAMQTSEHAETFDALLVRTAAAIDKLSNTQTAPAWPYWYHTASCAVTVGAGILAAVASAARDNKLTKAELTPIDLATCTAGVTAIAARAIGHVIDQVLIENPPGKAKALRQCLHRVRSAQTVAMNLAVGDGGAASFNAQSSRGDAQRVSAFLEGGASAQPFPYRLSDVNNNLTQLRPVMVSFVKKLEAAWSLPVKKTLRADVIEEQARQALKENFRRTLSAVLASDNAFTEATDEGRQRNLEALAHAITAMHRYTQGVASWEHVTFRVARAKRVSEMLGIAVGALGVAQVHLKDVRAPSDDINAIDFDLVRVGTPIGILVFAMNCLKSYWDTHPNIDASKELKAVIEDWEVYTKVSKAQ